MRNLELLDFAFSSGPCIVTVNAATVTRFQRAIGNGALDVNQGEIQVWVVEDFDELRGDTLSASLQASCSAAEECLKFTCKHRLGRLNALVNKILPYTLPHPAEQAYHAAVLRWIEDTKSRFPSTKGAWANTEAPDSTAAITVGTETRPGTSVHSMTSEADNVDVADMSCDEAATDDSIRASQSGIAYDSILSLHDDGARHGDDNFPGGIGQKRKRDDWSHKCQTLQNGGERGQC